MAARDGIMNGHQDPHNTTLQSSSESHWLLSPAECPHLLPVKICHQDTQHHPHPAASLLFPRSSTGSSPNEMSYKVSFHRCQARKNGCSSNSAVNYSTMMLLDCCHHQIKRFFGPKLKFGRQARVKSCCSSVSVVLLAGLIQFGGKQSFWIDHSLIVSDANLGAGPHDSVENGVNKDYIQ